MANIDFALLANAEVAAALQKTMLEMLGNRCDIYGNPVFVPGNPINGTGSNVAKTFINGFDLGTMASVADGGTLGLTTPSNAAVNVTVARQGIAAKITDLAAGVWAFESVQSLVEAVASGFVGAARRRFMELVIQLASTATQTAGSAGVAMSYAAFRAMIAKAEANDANPSGGIYLAPASHIAALRESVAAAVGTTQWRMDAQEMLTAKNGAYKGTLLDVHIYQGKASQFPVVGADTLGLLITRGGIAYNEMIVNQRLSGSEQVSAVTPILVEAQRVVLDGASVIAGHYHVGVSIAQQNALVQVIALT